MTTGSTPCGETETPAASVPPPPEPAPPAAPPDLAPRGSGRRFHTFDALIDVPAFRWCISSSFATQSALAMRQVTQGYLAYQITESFALLGLVELAHSLPRIVLSLYGGVLADRASRRVIIQAGQLVHTATAGLLALLYFGGWLRYEHLFVLRSCRAG